HRPNRLLAGRHDAPTDAPARPVRMNKKRAHARRLAPRVKLRVGVSSVAVAPVERPAFAPAAAAEDLRIPFDHEVSAVPNKLAVDAEDRPEGRLHLRRRIMRSLEYPDRQRDEGLEGRDVFLPGQTRAPVDRSGNTRGHCG